MDKEVEKFKEDYSNIYARVKMFRKKLMELKKESKSIAKAAGKLYNRGVETMYIADAEGGGIKWTPRISGLDDMVDNLENFAYLENAIMRAIDDIPQY